MRISEVANAAGCSIRAVRHMHACGAVPEPERLPNGYRDYAISDVAAIMRARALIDAGVPLSQINAPNAVPEALSLIDDQLAHLELQRTKLLALQQNPAGTPADIRDSILQHFGDSPTLLAELDSLDLIALAGVASPATWDQLRANLADPTCLASSQSYFTLWEKLAELPAATEISAEIAELEQLISTGFMRGVFETLRPGTLPLSRSDVPLQGAQAKAFKALSGAIDA
ncbi:MerR family transcriptional regulator [Corynebacterium lubricantis]|uniref:MerR family transcriptional regulator n=1 Tax=Corynebacterium lubricantis TaxID=541095 RepID=UPI000367353C|nr:MerR family transcriptional regulator [Corynebacterium lubricantis]